MTGRPAPPPGVHSEDPPPGWGLGALARMVIGDVFDVLKTLPDQSVHSVITSPPYWRKRRYLPEDHPKAAKEIGQEPSPGEYLATLLRLTDELWRIVRDDGTIWINLGDTAAVSGGAGGDYNKGGHRAGQNRYNGSGRVSRRRDKAEVAAHERAAGPGVPRAKSVCWIPELFGASLAYGRNLLTGEPCRQWITRPPITWCKPSPTPGEIHDKFREATELFVWAAKEPSYYFDLDAVREPPREDWDRKVKTGSYNGHPRSTHTQIRPDQVGNPKGVPPLTWWVVNTSGYEGAHYATFPPELIRRPLLASVPAQACSVCGKGRDRVYERSWELDESRPQAKRAMQLARAGGLTTEHLAAVAAMGISEGGKAKVVMNGSGRNSDRVKQLAAEAKAALGGYFREFCGAPLVQTGWTDCGCSGRNWTPGIVLDPFGGSGTTAAVATGHGRNCILIDFDENNADLARQRVGMFLEVESGSLFEEANDG